MGYLPLMLMLGGSAQVPLQDFCDLIECRKSPYRRLLHQDDHYLEVKTIGNLRRDGVLDFPEMLVLVA